MQGKMLLECILASCLSQIYVHIIIMIVILRHYFVSVMRHHIGSADLS